ncbi:hypothetical protein [Luteipulveratus mongoliensis]|uniref:hypothetical protein n=1 Tax=Luteipulveratus mongoliensis TaxID=571913 RepID=UPI00069752E1|nr:hypothetical protein [Luteipulveratus mongoliensis]
MFGIDMETPPPWRAMLLVAAVIVVGFLAYWVAISVARYVQAPSQVRRAKRVALVARARWHAVAQNTNLALVDQSRRGKTDIHGKPIKPRVRVPRARFYATDYGLLVVARTMPKVGLAEYEKAAPWLADAWRCRTVEVTQDNPKSVELRGLMGEPLSVSRPATFDLGSDWSLPLGRNPWGQDRYIALKNLSGIKVAGLPGYGKSMLMLDWYATLATSPAVQFAVFDGKTADARYGDWGQVADRAMFVVGDDPVEANRRLRDLVRLIKTRPAALMAERETHRFWTAGPTVANPLVLVLMDECHNYIDSSGLRGEEKALIDSNQRLMRTVAKEGRALGVIPVAGTQKQTADAIPTAVRDNLEVGVCFAVATLEGASAALGSHIREDEANHPTRLRDKEKHVGTCVVTGVPGVLGFDRVRVDHVDEQALIAAIAATVGLRRDVIPSDVQDTPVQDVQDAPAAPETVQDAPVVSVAARVSQARQEPTEADLSKMTAAQAAAFIREQQERAA